MSLFLTRLKRFQGWSNISLINQKFTSQKNLIQFCWHFKICTTLGDAVDCDKFKIILERKKNQDYLNKKFINSNFFPESSRISHSIMKWTLSDFGR
jgi:hypothetical protein